jgi:hypothetical protein
MTADTATTSAFLRYVHEHAIDAGIGGRVVISASLPPGSPAKYKSRSYRLDQLDDAADGARRISSSEMNGYCRVHLMARDLDHTSERGKGVDSRWLTHFAADVDIAGPGHKPAEGQILPPDVDTALALIDATLPPSCVISSGGGLYPIWRLSEPFEVIDDDDRQRIKTLGRRIDDALNGHGWHVDRTCVDLARIIRPPGVMNHKPGRDARPVTVLRGYCDGAGDYSLDQLEAKLPAPSAEKLDTIKPRQELLTRVPGTGQSSAPWDILAERYTIDDVLAADPHDQYVRVADQYDGTMKVPAWLRAGSSADYSLKAGSGGAYIVWSSTMAARLGIDPGGGVNLWQLLCAFDGVDTRSGARWSA